MNPIYKKSLDRLQRDLDMDDEHIEPGFKTDIQVVIWGLLHMDQEYNRLREAIIKGLLASA